MNLERQRGLSLHQTGADFDVLEKRVRAWIAGFGMGALKHKDIATVFAVLGILAKEETVSDEKLQNAISTFATSLLGLPENPSSQQNQS